MTMKPAARIAAFKFSVSAKSAGGSEELEERANPAIREGYAAVNRLKR
jgi:hypothetical protein